MTMAETPYDNAQGQAWTDPSLSRNYTINDLRDAYLRGAAETEAKYAALVEAVLEALYDGYDTPTFALSKAIMSFDKPAALKESDVRT